MRWAVLGVALCVLVPATVVLGSRLGDDPGRVRSVRVGQRVAPFTLSTIDGETISSGDLSGRVYVVNFWAPWCLPCRREHPALEAFYQRYRGRGVELLGVVYNDDADSARRYRDELGGDWPLLTDPEFTTALDFGVTGPPETYVVDSTGTITSKWVGAVRAGQLEGEMARIGVS